MAGLGHQFLHAYELHFPQMEGELEALSDRTFRAELPEELEKDLTKIKYTFLRIGGQSHEKSIDVICRGI